MKKAYGTHFIAGICQVTRHTIGRWIDEGKLPAFATAGGQRRVWAEDLVRFLQAHDIPVPPELRREAPPAVLLIVDDEPAIRRMARRVLERLYPGAQVHEAADGFEAGQKMSLFSPRLVLLDIKLPGIDGVRVCRLIRENESLKGVKILAMSGEPSPELEGEVLAAGAEDFIAKPFELGELERRLRRLLPPGTDHLGGDAGERD